MDDGFQCASPGLRPWNLRLRTRIFERELWEREDIRTLPQLAERMGVTTGSLSKLQSGVSWEPSAAIIRGAVCAFPGRTVGELFYLERTGG